MHLALILFAATAYATATTTLISHAHRTLPYLSELDFALPKPASYVDRFIAKMQRTLTVSHNFPPFVIQSRHREWACPSLFWTRCVRIDFWTHTQLLVPLRRGGRGRSRSKGKGSDSVSLHARIRYTETPEGEWHNPSSTTTTRATLRVSTARVNAIAPPGSHIAGRLRFLEGPRPPRRFRRFQRGRSRTTAAADWIKSATRDGNNVVSKLEDLTAAVVMVSRGYHDHTVAANTTRDVRDTSFPCPPRSVCRASTRTYHVHLEGVCELRPEFDCDGVRDPCAAADDDDDALVSGCAQLDAFRRRSCSLGSYKRRPCSFQAPILAGWQEAPMTLIAYTVEPMAAMEEEVGG